MCFGGKRKKCRKEYSWLPKVERRGPERIDIRPERAAISTEARRFHVQHHHLLPRRRPNDGQHVEPVIGNGVDEIVAANEVQRRHGPAVAAVEVTEQLHLSAEGPRICPRHDRGVGQGDGPRQVVFADDLLEGIAPEEIEVVAVFGRALGELEEMNVAACDARRENAVGNEVNSHRSRLRTGFEPKAPTAMNPRQQKLGRAP